MKKQLAALTVLLCAAVPAAKADETGLAGIHAIAYESGRRACMTDHFHDGSGTGKTRKAAEAAARNSWISFTAFEYGSDWASFALAASKTMNCTNSGDSWSCSTAARPCRHASKPAQGTPRSASR
ncbi:MAG TPA: hypothetical protein VH858_08315 [Hyphomicrobiales bacterium]|jgi:hypothetical protein